MRIGLVAPSAVALMAATALTGCSDPATVPSQDEALEALDVAYDSRTADASAFCSEVAASTSNCEDQFAWAGPAPREPPTVQCEGVYEPSSSAYQPGRILRVIGQDVAGNDYETEVMAISTSDGVALINPVYWSGAGITEEGSTGSDAASSPLLPCEEAASG